MTNFTITLSDTEVKSLEYASVSVQDWIQGAASARALIGQEEIIAKLVAHCNENDITIKNSTTSMAYTFWFSCSSA